MQMFFRTIYLSILLLSLNCVAEDAVLATKPEVFKPVSEGFRTKPETFQFGGPKVLNFDLLSLDESYGMEFLAPKEKSKDVVDCQNNQLSDGFGKRVNTFALSMDAISSLSACMDIKQDPGERFTTDNCKMLIGCSKTKLDKDLATQASFKAIPRLIAEDYVGMKLNSDISSMEKMERLRKFAEKKYGKDFASVCKSPFNYNSAEVGIKDKCEVSIMESGFNRLQNKCAPTKYSCFNSGVNPQKEYTAFLNSFKPTNDNDSAVQAFFNSRADSAVNDSLLNDNDLLENLASIMSSKGNSNDKIKSIFTKLGEYKNQGKLDPVFSYGTEIFSGNTSQLKQSMHYDFFQKLLSKPQNMASARAAIEKHRRDFTKNVLTKTCPSETSFMEVCAAATDLYNSKPMKLFDRIGMARNINDDADDERFEILKTIYNNGIQNKDDYKIVMDAGRCKAFGFADSFDLKQSLANMYNPVVDSTANPYLNLGLNPNGTFSSANWLKYKPSSLAEDKIGAPSAEGAKQDTSPVFKIDTPPTTAGKLNPTAPAQSDSADTFISSTGNEKTLSSTFSEGLKDSVSGINSPANTLQNNNYINSNSFSNTASLVDSNSASVNSGAALSDGKKSAINASAALNDKISELTNRLSSAEDNLEKVKAEKAAADSEKEHQKKIDDENKTITDLKNQITDLKTQTTKVTADAPSAKSADVNTNTNTAVNTLSSRAPASVEDTSSDYSSNSKRAVPDASQVAARSNNFSGGSDAVSGGAQRAPASSAAVSGAVSGYSKSGIVLTKIDGLSAEKASETINDKIIELGGQPFEIEEGGMVKQIVPIVKDGKVLLDEKGKPRYAKVVKRKVKSEEDKNRAPTSIVDSADLKRDDEEKAKRERAEYLKLKKITNEVVEKK